MLRTCLAPSSPTQIWGSLSGPDWWSLFTLQAPSFLPTASAIEEDQERFESAELFAKGETAQENVVYGLTKMGPKTKEVPEEREERPGEAQ